AHVHEAAVRRVDFHHEVDPREVFVLVRQPEVGALGPAHDEGIVPFKREHLALVRAGRHREADAHGAFTCWNPVGAETLAALNYARPPRPAQVFSNKRLQEYGKKCAPPHPTLSPRGWGRG